MQIIFGELARARATDRTNKQTHHLKWKYMHEWLAVSRNQRPMPRRSLQLRVPIGGMRMIFVIVLSCMVDYFLIEINWKHLKIYDEWKCFSADCASVRCSNIEYNVRIIIHRHLRGQTWWKTLDLRMRRKTEFSKPCSWMCSVYCIIVYYKQFDKQAAAAATSTRYMASGWIFIHVYSTNWTHSTASCTRID